jgi:hypothetical protein
MDALTDPARIPSVSGAKQQGGTTSISQASSQHDFFSRFPWRRDPAAALSSPVAKTPDSH